MHLISDVYIKIESILGEELDFVLSYKDSSVEECQWTAEFNSALCGGLEEMVGRYDHSKIEI